MAHSVLIPMDEYKQLMSMKNELVKAFMDKKIILYRNSYYPGHSGYPVNEYMIVNETQVIIDLKEEIAKLNTEIFNLRASLVVAHSEEKKWWHF